MKNKIYNILFVVLLVGVTSCSDDFIDLDPPTAISLDKAIESLDGYQTAVFGAYSALQSSNYYGRYFILVPDVMSDDVKQNSQANRAQNFSDYIQTAQDGIAEGMFNSGYSAILRANGVINAVVELPASVSAEVNQFRGEAYGIRALAHFDLVRFFAKHYGFTGSNDHLGMPIVTVFDQNARPGRNTVAEVYNQIKSDLNEAISLMSSSQTNSGRFSKEAAQALLARVNLYQGNWGEVESLASAVINSGKYTLSSNGSYVSDFADGGSPEAILEIKMNQADNNGSDALGRMYIVDGYGDYLPSQDVLDLIPDGDARLGNFKADENLSGVYGSVRVNKFPDIAGINNTPVIRLSEMYLLRAEARFRQSNEDGAKADINVIRKRGLPTAADVAGTGDALWQEIMNERRIELMFEGHRLWDLMRWGMDINRINCTNSTCTQANGSNFVIAPIPADEINANENIQQNPGY